jgi:hypothetical protein
VPDKPPSSSDLVPPGFHFSDSSYSDAAFDNYLDDMIQEGQDMVKASSDVDVEMKGENASKRSRSQADAPAERVPNPNDQHDPGNIFWQLPDNVRDEIRDYPGHQQLAILDQYLNRLLGSLTTLQQSTVNAAKTPLGRFNHLRRFLQLKKLQQEWEQEQKTMGDY